MNTEVKIMSGDHVHGSIGLDSPKIGQKVKIDGAHYRVEKHADHGIVVSMDKFFEGKESWWLRYRFWFWVTALAVGGTGFVGFAVNYFNIWWRHGN